MHKNTQEHQIKFTVSTAKIYLLFFSNLIFTSLTLGIYTFWAKTKIRKLIIGHMSLDGDNFEYTGTGKELFLGFLKASFLYIIAIFILDYFAKMIILTQNPILTIIAAITIYVGIFTLLYLGKYFALRYRYSRITWRGVRGKLTGKAVIYASKAMLYAIYNIFTLGLFKHMTDAKLYKLIVDNSYFGSAKASFDDNEACKLFKINFITLLLAIPTIGISRIWYHAAKKRFFYARTKINNIQLKATHDGKELLILHLINLIIIMFTLGFGMPIVLKRVINYEVANTYFIGNINTANITQSDEKLKNSGEAIESIMGDSDLGII